jgi:hypothetical protein
MTKNPLHNATVAFLYIIGVVTFLRGVSFFSSGKPDNEFFAPIGALSLLVLSVATMAYLFFYTPLALLLKSDKEAASRHFLLTLGYFAIFALTSFILIISLS